MFACGNNIPGTAVLSDLDTTWIIFFLDLGSKTMAFSFSVRDFLGGWGIHRKIRMVLFG